MKHTSLTAIVLSAAIFVAAPVLAYDGQKYEKDAKITLEQATAIALKLRPTGIITSKELEKEKGGSGLRFTFDIKVGKKTYEVGVDAVTGAVLENSPG